ncbi:unnamed protein product, partial [Laminaria digitata]
MSASAWRKLTIGIFVHIAFVAIWWISVIVAEVPEYILPTPWLALQTLGEPNYNWVRHFFITTQEVFGGYLLATVVAVAFAVLFTWSRRLDEALMPLLVTLNMIPKVAM